LSESVTIRPSPRRLDPVGAEPGLRSLLRLQREHVPKRLDAAAASGAG